MLVFCLHLKNAFAAQERVLGEMVRKLKPPEFYEELAPRLGPGQARILTDEHYGRRT